MADFRNSLISRLFSVFWSGFLHRTTVNDFRMDLDRFFGILIFDLSEDFPKALALACWPIFKMVSFFDYLVFFGAVFLQRSTVYDL